MSYTPYNVNTFESDSIFVNGLDDKLNDNILNLGREFEKLVSRTTWRPRPAYSAKVGDVYDDAIRVCDESVMMWEDSYYKCIAKADIHSIVPDYCTPRRCRLYPMRLLRYNVGGHFVAHTDSRLADTHVGTLLLYPPAHIMGGFTGGDLLIYDNRGAVINTICPSTFTEWTAVTMTPDVMHSCTPVLSGVRYVFKGPLFVGRQQLLNPAGGAQVAHPNEATHCEAMYHALGSISMEAVERSFNEYESRYDSFGIPDLVPLALVSSIPPAYPGIDPTDWRMIDHSVVNLVPKWTATVAALNAQMKDSRGRHNAEDEMNAKRAKMSLQHLDSIRSGQHPFVDATVAQVMSRVLPRTYPIPDSSLVDSTPCSDVWVVLPRWYGMSPAAADLRGEDHMLYYGIKSNFPCSRVESAMFSGSTEDDCPLWDVPNKFKRNLKLESGDTILAEGRKYWDRTPAVSPLVLHNPDFAPTYGVVASSTSDYNDNSYDHETRSYVTVIHVIRGVDSEKAVPLDMAEELVAAAHRRMP